MPGQRLREDDTGMSTLMKVLAMLIVFAIVVAVYFGAFAYKAPPQGASPKIAELKDTVSIQYIGAFEDSLVFDTSISAVANDNATYPKALSFQWRASYSNFAFAVGKTDCSDGSTDCAIVGMSNAVLGLKEGDRTTATIPPDQGYGQKDQRLVQVRPLAEELPVREVMNFTAFQKRYKVVPNEGSVVTDPFWGWTSLVHVSGGMVTVENSPVISHEYPLYVNKTKGGTWAVEVTSIDDGANNGTGIISILDRFTFLAGNKLRVADTSGDIFVTENEDGTYTVDRNREVVGVNLVFTITIVQITKSS